jgi:mono/diheme cytochrome c family protein/glucose/arabinose dehydrogenase
MSALAACLTLMAQTPAPAPGTPPPGRTQSADLPSAAVPTPQAGRGQAGVGRGAVQEPDPFEGADLSPKDPVTGVSPAEEQKRFLLQPGFRIEPVLTEPEIEEPMQIAFDGNGRMFVVEIRGYMQDADATGELAPTGLISVHEDVNNDGVYEKHSVFVDKLVFPRFVTPFGANAVLTMESNTDEVWKYTDTNGDSVADKKELFTTSFGRSGNVEHQQSSLFWGMDNWLYSTYNAFRIRPTPTGVLRESTAPNNSQWGITQDNEGKVWFQGGASGLPGYFQLPIHYGVTFAAGGGGAAPRFLEPGFEVPWGIAGLGDFQPGTSAIRPGELTLQRVTGAAGNDIVRAHRMPADMQGDYVYGEPVARIVRRAKPIHAEGITTLRQVYQWQHAEFIRSSDHLFRPVDIATAPDGTIYVVDPYRGIIQEGNWTRPGSYLRAKVDQYRLASNIRKGRIWRVTYEGIDRDTTQPRMLNETPAQLVDRLSHPNGWWRDAAQQLLVLKQDKSVVPALQRMVRTSNNLFARFHALWTLEGLNALDLGLVREQMKDPNPQMRIQAIRASETLYKAGQRALVDDYRAAARDADTDVMIQGMLTLYLFKAPDLPTVVAAAQAASTARGVQLIGARLLQPVTVLTGGGRGGLTTGEQSTLQRGETIYSELCSICHGPDGRGAPGEGGGTIKAPSFVGSPRVQGHRDYVVNAILHGLTGPIDGRTYSDVMVPMGTNRDDWIAAAASYVRNNFGNSSSFVTPEDVARVRAATADRKTPWTFAELDAALPAALLPQNTWNVTASHNGAAASGALNYAGWSSGAPQQAGMWLQIELPEPVMLTEIQFNSTPQAGGRGGVPGGRGRGAGENVPVTPPPPPVGTFPRGYQVQVSMDGKTWGPPAAEGQGSGSTTMIAFRPVRTKFVRITQTATVENAPVWSIQRLRLYQARGRAPGSAMR